MYGAGPLPDRVLLCGGSSAVGFGVLDHELGLAGHLARSIAGVTGRGTAIEVVGDPGLTISTIGAELTEPRLGRADVLVLTLGTREAFEFMSVTTWVGELSALLDLLLARDVPIPIVVVGAEETLPAPVPRWLVSRALSRAAALNAASREVIHQRPGVEYVDSGMVAGDGRASLYDHDLPNLYSLAALALTPTLSRLLDARGHRETHPFDEIGRLAAIDTIRTRPPQVDAELRDLVTRLRQVLATGDAALVIVDSDQVWPIVPDRSGNGARPRENSLSDATLHHEALHVRDLRATTQFDGIGPTGPERVRAYASHVVPSPTGDPVGVLAVGDSEPRDFSESDLAILREFALRAGAVLFRDSGISSRRPPQPGVPRSSWWRTLRA